MVDLTTPTTTTYIAGGGITAASIIALIYLYIYPKFLRGRDFLQNGNLIKGLCSIFAVSTILTSCELFAYENLISQQLQNLITKEINNNKICNDTRGTSYCEGIKDAGQCSDTQSCNNTCGITTCVNNLMTAQDTFTNILKNRKENFDMFGVSTDDIELISTLMGGDIPSGDVIDEAYENVFSAIANQEEVVNQLSNANALTVGVFIILSFFMIVMTLSSIGYPKIKVFKLGGGGFWGPTLLTFILLAFFQVYFYTITGGVYTVMGTDSEEIWGISTSTTVGKKLLELKEYIIKNSAILFPTEEIALLAAAEYMAPDSWSWNGTEWMENGKPVDS